MSFNKPITPTSSISTGYDCQFVFPCLMDDQKCPICLHVIRYACRVNCCGKLFCEGCLQSFQKSSNKCPMCRQAIDDNYSRSSQVDMMIESALVYCGNKASGCEWRGDLKSLNVHMSSCDYRKIKCVECGEMLLKLLTNLHILEKCPMRRHTCPYCGKSGGYQFITTEHKDTCPELRVECGNKGCLKKVRRVEMEAHAQVCPKQIVKCPFHVMGCGFNSKRELLPCHIESEFASHVDTVARQAQVRYLPLTFKMAGVSRFESNDSSWFSDDFYTGPGGYNLRLKVYPNGVQGCHTTHLSVVIVLMEGVNDDNLEFPMKGRFVVELLNQMEDRNHYKCKFTFDDDTPRNYRKHQVERRGSAGIVDFIDQRLLKFDAKYNTQYLKNDNMFFRVKASIYSETKPWLFTAIP